MRDLNDLAIFAAVVTHRGFSAASRALGVPKSSISRRVTRLEAELGVRLLERSTRRFSVTEIGQEFYGHCKAVMTDIEAAEEVAARVHSEPKGLVRASCPPGMAQGAIAAGLPRFLAENPKVRVQLLVTNRRIDLIDDGVDVAIRARNRLDGESGFQMRAFGESRLLLVASPALAARLGRPQTPAALAGLPTIGMSQRPAPETWSLIGPGGRHEAVEHEPVLSCDDFTVLITAAVAGTGFALLPEAICGNALRAGQLEHILPGWHGGEDLIHLVFTSRRGLLPAVRAFIDFVSQAIPVDCKNIMLNGVPQKVMS